MVDDPRRFVNLTSWLIRYKHVYELFKEKALNRNESMLTEDEYNNIVRNVPTGNYDELFEKHPEEFRSIPIRSWVEKI